jgi:hypothetical protein
MRVAGGPKMTARAEENKTKGVTRRAIVACNFFALSAQLSLIDLRHFALQSLTDQP